MFLPRSASSSQRNPRRRQRTGSDDSVKPPRAKRQRSTLGQKTSDSSERPGDRPRDDALDQAELTIDNGVISASSDSPGVHNQLPIRSLKKAGKKGDEIDGTALLSETDFYTVAQLPALPDQIRSSQSGDLTCFFSTACGHALALTQSQAIIWPYSISASSPSPADTFTLAIPDTCREPNNAPPLGVLLSTVTAGVPGLMVVMRRTGKIVYWETVSSAASLGLPRQKQTGLQGCVPNLLSGEVVTDIANGEPSGVILTLSSGRVAHVSVRDSQGKAKITVHFLSNSFGSGRMGLFSGLKNVLGGSFGRKDLVAVRAGESHQRGQRDVIIANSTGHFEIWDTHWNHGSVLKKQLDIKPDICNILGPNFVNSTGDYELRVLDFTVTPGDHTDNLPSEGQQSVSLSVIVAPERTAPNELFLAQIEVCEGVSVSSIKSIDLRGIPAPTEYPKPQLILPRPGDTAFVLIGQSIILLSLAPVTDSPSRQLLLDSERAPQTFHDTINLRSGKSYEVLGSGFEDQSTENPHPACLLMLRDFGVVRISALPRQRLDADGEDSQITAKHKIEQAIFYGTISGNPLNLDSRASLDYPANEIEQAALDICGDLLRSTTRFIPTTAISIHQNLRSRAKAFDDLASLLIQQNKAFDRQTWWELLWGAEKIAAQRAIWKIEEDARKNKGKTFLTHVIESMSEKFKTKVRAEGDDPVRNWFLYDTFRMEHIVPWIFNAVKPQKGYSTRQGRKISEKILEASELSLAVLETAFRFRDEHASRYGLGDGYLEDGVLVTGYNGLPEFWTSQSISYMETGHLLDLELDSCRAWIQQRNSNSEMPEDQIVSKISKNSSRQLRVLGQMHTERVRWLSAQQDSKLADESVAAEQSHIKQRKWQLFKLAGIGQLEEAISLAEKFRDMDALVELIIELQDQRKTEDNSDLLDGGADALGRDPYQIGEKISLYFEKFGEPWADAFFTRQISMGQSGILFSMRKFQPFITRFLRKHPAYSRLAWINDVLGENKYNAAADSLQTLAMDHETDLWTHRVELSIAKLAKLATWEESIAPADSLIHSDIRRLEDLTEIDAVQEVIYAYISPFLQGAIDQKAELDLAIDHLGKTIAGDRPSLHELLSETLRMVIARQVIGAERLIDFLTLMNPTQVTEYDQNELLGKEFYLALRVSRLDTCSQQDSRYHAAMQRLIWRRCMIKDDWVETGKAAERLGSESESSAYDTSLFRTLSLCLGDRHSEGGEPSLYIPNSPEEVLLNESDAEVLASRFRAEQRGRITQDFKKESDILSRYIEHGKLGFWFTNLLASGEEAVTHATGLAGPTKEPAAQSPEPTGGSSEKARLSWL
ncbi:Non-repetitive/WGA-negative nucleoporin C-terminal-domain-containing protein [Aspergillus ambiguus]|uniref:putative nuclear pore complex subunit Nup133 n=1 Tax=Aspergillus ambiguus TaxID=176160 RepID=UPI003CCE07D9